LGARTAGYFGKGRKGFDRFNLAVPARADHGAEIVDLYRAGLGRRTGRLQSHFANRGIGMTQQRRAILRVMETATKHLDAAQLLRKAQKVDASVDRSTVYRTLQLLKRHGLIDELDLMHIHGEGHYYEQAEPGPHPHGLPQVRQDHGVRQRYFRGCHKNILASKLLPAWWNSNGGPPKAGMPCLRAK